MAKCLRKNAPLFTSKMHHRCNWRESAHYAPQEQGETTTDLTFGNACGQVYPPLVIFKGAMVNDAWMANAPSNITV